MNLALLALTILFAVPMALWPILWLFVLGRQAFSRRWLRAGQVALLLPLWTIAASVAALQFPRLLIALNAEKVPPGLLFAAVAIGVATCFATLAWLLLIRSFRTDAVQTHRRRAVRALAHAAAASALRHSLGEAPVCARNARDNAASLP